MDEILKIYDRALFDALKKRVRGYVKVHIDDRTDSLYVFIKDGIIKYETGVFNLHDKALYGTWNLDKEVETIIRGYKKHILDVYLKSN